MELRQLLISMGAILVVFSQSAMAIDRAPASVSPMIETHSFPTDYCSSNCASDQSLPTELIEVYKHVKAENSANFDYGKLVPTTLQSGQDPNAAINQIADKSLNYWWDNSGAKQSPLGSQLNSVQKNMQTNVNLGDQSGPVKQKINLSYDAFQSQAKLKYEGYANLEMYYKTSDSSMGAQMVNKIGTNKELNIGEIRSAVDQTSNVTFKWNW